ncbi:glycosyltransferase family 2 protein [Halomonas sp. HP20-15]|uniref:glycosyltransferase family 2 protein n=1 Tax=Halomonas sp. HP20-15 TaxID=3085901 RepID=UPI002981A76F|nr:glycosyltransferase family 2 protein [Halomonas sp. HP20-15]MDW5377028.1 glycosyltransferase family 2 protein [Halomonas sp. HP20-15]
MKELKISIITASYNSQRTIGDAIASLKRQDWSAVEHIVIDGLSTDATVAIARDALTTRDILVSEKDQGIFDALNKGLSRASGDIVGFLNSDDLLADDRVLSRVASCFEDPDVGAVYGDLQYVSADNLSKVIRYWRSGPFSHHKVKRGWMPPHPTFYMRRELYQLLGGFDDSYRIAGDYEALLRYLCYEDMRVAYLPQVLVKMRLGGASNGTLKAILNKTREDFRAMQKNGINPFVALPYKNLSKLPQFF